MEPLSWAAFALIALMTLGGVLLHYRRREAPGRGRAVLAGLRWGVLVLVILLLFDPRLPAVSLAGAAGEAGTRVLLDASASMGLSGPDGTSHWAMALDTIRRLGPTGGVTLFGEAIRRVSLDTLAAAPADDASRLLPALRSAAEAGARRVTVVSDGRVEDAEAANAAARRLGIAVDLRRIDAVAENYAVSELDAPRWAETGELLEVRAGIEARDAGRDSITVVLRDDGRAVARARVAVPAAGRVATATLRYMPRAPEEGRLARLDVAIEGGDAAPADDGRTAYTFVSGEPAGVAVVSFRPDWEPRFLAPVLERALGVPARGFLRVTDVPADRDPGDAPGSRWIRMGSADEAGGSATGAEVERAVAAARLVVLHGYGPDAPGWARDAAQARRVLVFPAGAADGAGLPLDPGGEEAGDWYVAEALPSSPVAPLLAGLELDALPPLSRVRTVQPGTAWAPILLRRARRGTGAPALVADGDGRRRWALALADGFWRWAFAPGAGRQAYERLWAAVAGWLVQDARAFAAAPLQPVDRVVRRGRPVRWLAALPADSVRVTMEDSAGAVVLDTVGVPVRDTVVTGALPPGHYTYRLVAHGAETAVESEGPLTVERYTPEPMRPVSEITGVPDGGATAAGAGRAAGRPLHASAWPYVALVLLLCSEWILRRRWGLR